MENAYIFKNERKRITMLTEQELMLISAYRNLSAEEKVAFMTMVEQVCAPVEPRQRCEAPANCCAVVQ